MSMDQRSRRLHILVLEPYYGGSHQVFIDTLIEHSRHRFTLWELPARKWKWRMRGASLWFAEQLAKRPLPGVDMIFTNDMLSVADLRALLPCELQACPMVCYFHENQLTYPLRDEAERDYQYGFTNITSCLASDEVWFNSSSHRRAFVDAVEKLLRKMPDRIPANVVNDIEKRSRVCWPLVEPPPYDYRTTEPVGAGPLTVVWNHRWEYDKNPEPFFRTLLRLDAAGVDFQLVLLGESFRDMPAVFGERYGPLKRRICHSGFVAPRRDYWRILGRCDIVVSTARQENFGLAVVEAILAGCYPLLPRRLSYPELIPRFLHARHLFDSEDDLFGRLKGLLLGEHKIAIDPELPRYLRNRCAAAVCINMYDNMLQRVLGGHTAAIER